MKRRTQLLFVSNHIKCRQVFKILISLNRSFTTARLKNNKLECVQGQTNGIRKSKQRSNLIENSKLLLYSEYYADSKLLYLINTSYLPLFNLQSTIRYYTLQLNWITKILFIRNHVFEWNWFLISGGKIKLRLCQ